jgi:murein DD-endopeptidase MepM/ murein hydrolase activator NlpD
MKQLIILQISLLAAFLWQKVAAQKLRFADNLSSKKFTEAGAPGNLPLLPALKGKSTAGGVLFKKTDKKSASSGKKVTGPLLITAKQSTKKTIKKTEAPDSLVNAVKGNLQLPFTVCSIQQQYGQMDMGSYKLYNPGITFVSPAPVAARSCYDAIVENVVEVEGMYVVIASCKKIYFGYSNLEEVFVKKGDSIKMGTPVGTISMDETGNYTLLFLVQVAEKETNPHSWFKIEQRRLLAAKEWD